MSRDLERFRTFSRRAFLMAGGKAFLLVTLLGRLFQLQVLKSDRYMTLAEENRVSVRLLPPIRGKILDAEGEALALNRDNYRLTVTPEDAGDVKKMLGLINQLTPLEDFEIEKVLKDMKRQKPFEPLVVKEDLTWEEVAKIEVNSPDLPGVAIDVGRMRSYPMGAYGAHLIGYVGEPNKKETQKDAHLIMPEIRVGKNGVEKYFDDMLMGEFGRSEAEVNAHGHIVKEIAKNDGKPGEDLRLTVHKGLQEYIGQRMEGQSGAVIVMNAKNGDILAMTSSPGFDPNRLSHGISSKDWRDMSQDEMVPLVNKALSGQYAPGSTFKIVTALAVLESGVVTTDFRVNCPGHYTLGNRQFHCWKKEGHGPMNLHDAVTHSCDVYFYDVSKRMGIDHIVDIARKLGFGVKTGIEMTGEKDGFIPSREWKEKRFGQGWQQGETLINAIGQGYVTATPFQLVMMAARIAGGLNVKPHLLLRENHTQANNEFEALPIDPKSLAYVRQAMADVVNTGGGTAYAARIMDAGKEMAGKTGTAQVRFISASEHLAGVKKNEILPWNQRDHALFVGFAPVNDPKFAISVVLEHGGSGGHVAAPVARDILKKTQELL